MFGQWMGDNRIDLELGNKEVSETFEDLKRNKEIIKNIDKDFFFKLGETVLNLLQTQQAEIEHQKEKRENQKKELAILNEKQKEFNKLRNTVNSYKGQFKRQQAEIDSLKDFKEIAESKITDLNPIGLARTNQLLSRQCHKLQEESEKKDKIIDEMANSFAEEGFYSEHCQTLIDNDICPDDCNKCVKQYFERKAKNE